MNNEPEGDEIAMVVKNSLGYFVEEYKPKNITFPVMNSTYALWRKYAYKQVQELPIFNQA
jgi:hypothetical protein